MTACGIPSVRRKRSTHDELENGENWELVNSNEAEGKQYIARKAIPIARILSLA